MGKVTGKISNNRPLFNTKLGVWVIQVVRKSTGQCFSIPNGKKDYKRVQSYNGFLEGLNQFTSLFATPDSTANAAIAMEVVQ